jgi:hypothetical protein
VLKSLLVASALLVAGSSATAGEVYVNPEFNAGVGTDSGFGSAILETHVGYEFDNGIYVQAGPAVTFPDGGESEIELSGKTGLSHGPLYGEVSFITGDDELNLGFKAGAKFYF